MARGRLPFTEPARLIAPPYNRNFSVSVVFPASGWEMIANVLLFSISLCKSAKFSPPTCLYLIFHSKIFKCIISNLILNLIYCNKGKNICQEPTEWLFTAYFLPQYSLTGQNNPALSLRYRKNCLVFLYFYRVVNSFHTLQTVYTLWNGLWTVFPDHNRDLP